MVYTLKWLGLQLFGEGGDGGSSGATGGESATSAENAPVAEEQRLKELGVPDSVLAKRSKRAKTGTVATPSTSTSAQSADNSVTTVEPTTEGNNETVPARMTWDEIMADPEYNKEMQKTMQARLKSAKGAEESLNKLAPAIELLARKYGLDTENLDVSALTDAINDDDSYYEDKALEMGVPIETAKKIDQSERQAAREQAEQNRTIEQQKIINHLDKLKQQSEQMKAIYPNFDLEAELQNPAFFRMTSPNVGISVEDAFFAVHRKEIQQHSMQITAQKTAERMANAIRSGQGRPVENGTTSQAPSNTMFDYAHASKEQREALKKQIREASARGQKVYPGQF